MLELRSRTMGDALASDFGEALKGGKHLDEGTSERAYWHAGYVTAMRDALRMIQERVGEYPIADRDGTLDSYLKQDMPPTGQNSRSSRENRDRPPVCLAVYGRSMSESQIVRHSRGQICPRCAQKRFCDDCGVCAACRFCLPPVDLPHPPPPAPRLCCPECGCGTMHDRTCPVTRRAVAN
jgi:hypothetical protein